MSETFDLEKLLAEANTTISEYRTSHPKFKTRNSCAGMTQQDSRRRFIQEAENRLTVLENGNLASKLNVDDVTELLFLRSVKAGPELAEEANVLSAPTAEPGVIEAGQATGVEMISLPRQQIDDWYVRFAAASITGQMTPDKRTELHELVVEIAALIEEHGS